MTTAGHNVDSSDDLTTIVGAQATGDINPLGAAADCPGATITVVTTNANTKVMVQGVFDFDVSAFTSSGLAAGNLVVDGATQAGGALFAYTAAAQRATVGQCWLVTLAAAGSHVLKLIAAKAGGTATVVSRQAHTTITALVLDRL